MCAYHRNPAHRIAIFAVLSEEEIQDSNQPVTVDLEDVREQRRYIIKGDDAEILDSGDPQHLGNLDKAQDLHDLRGDTADRGNRAQGNVAAEVVAKIWVVG